MIELERPSRVDYWATLTPGTDGSIWAVRPQQPKPRRRRALSTGRDRARGRADRHRCRRDATSSAVARGMAIFPSDGNAWLSPLDELNFEQVSTTPPPIVLTTGTGGPDRGIELEHIGRLSIDGSEVDGFTSRLVQPSGEDVLLRVIDANVRVQRVDALRALRSGKAVASLQRAGDHPRRDRDLRGLRRELARGRGRRSRARRSRRRRRRGRGARRRMSAPLSARSPTATSR